MPSHKIAKIESDMVRTISEIIFTEARDELLKSITITGAKVSSDLSYAKIYFTSIKELDKKDIEKEVNEASSFIRTLVADRLDLRHTPKLEFIFDKSISYGNKIEKIINTLHDGGINDGEKD